MKNMPLKPQDFLLALKLVAMKVRRWTYASLASELGLSASEAHACVKRGLQSELLEVAAAWPAPGTAGGVLEEPAAQYRVRARPRRPGKVIAAAGLLNEPSPPYNDNPARVRAAQLAEFAVHGARYAFPAERLPNGPGVPTARSWPAAARWLPPGHGEWVWPHPQGQAEGQGIEPLHPGVPYAAMQDPVLHELLALFDALRVGDELTREQAASRLHATISACAVL
jgi:hypothetical protein